MGGRSLPYNAAMTDRDLPPEPSDQPTPPAAVNSSERPPIDLSRLPQMPVHPRSQRAAGSNIGRWATFGCVAILLMLVVLLVIGVNLTKRTMWMAYARAQQRLVEELPDEIGSGERMRTERNLQRFRARVEITEDPFPLMGDFLGRVTSAFDDEALSVEEVSDLNRFLERSLEHPEAGSP
jgi:hypothetical protein